MPNTTISSDATVLAEKFQEWEAQINGRVVERTREVKGLVIAVLSQAHHLQLGPPGTAKSYLITTALSMVEDAKVMEILLHGYSVMEDMYGPISLKALDEDRYRRQTDTYVPWADFVFADEVFKANPTMLNTNLWAFNERKFRNDGQVTSIPLISAFFASNEGPEDATLQAFDDRIHLRYMVGPIRDPGNRLTMFRMRLANPGPPEPVLTIQDIRDAHECVRDVIVSDAVLEGMNDLQEALNRIQIRPTDRKFNDALTVIKATAFFNGRTTATVDDLQMLRDMFWKDARDIPNVAEQVAELANPWDKKALTLKASVDLLGTQVEDILAIEQKAIRQRRGVQLHHKMQDANQEITETREAMKTAGSKSDVLEETRRTLHSLTKRLLERGFGAKVPAKLSNEELQALPEGIEEESEGPWNE